MSERFAGVSVRLKITRLRGDTLNNSILMTSPFFRSTEKNLGVGAATTILNPAATLWDFRLLPSPMNRCFKSAILRAVPVLILSLLLARHSAAATTTVTLNPSADGSISSNLSIVTINYLTAAGATRGVAVFPLNALTGSIQSAFLDLNPYGLPVAPTGTLFGMAATSGNLVSSQYTGGSNLGAITFPSGTTFGQVRRFDVTAFIQTLDADFVAFRIETSSGIMQLSSLEYNYGKPAQLVVTLVPEPGSLALGGLTAGMLLMRRRRESPR